MAITKVIWNGGSHQEWLAQRKETEGLNSLETTRFGASDVGTIIHSNKWKCPNRLFLHMIGRYSSEWRTAKSVGGHLLESVVANHWESWVSDEDEALLNLERGNQLRKTKPANYFLLNDKYPQLFASIDRLHDGEAYSPFTGALYDELTPIELKTTEKDYFRLWGDEMITPSYLDQVMAQMMVSNTKVAVFCVLVNGVYFHVREVEYDSFLADKIDYETRKFADICKAGKQILDLMKDAKSDSEYNEYQAMLDSIAPEPTELEDEQVLTKELFGNSKDLVKGDENDFKYLLDYQQAHDNIKALEEAKQLAKNSLLRVMKDAEVMEFEGGKITYRRADLKRDYFALKLYK
jgi:hypothetical protein